MLLCLQVTVYTKLDSEGGGGSLENFTVNIRNLICITSILEYSYIYILHYRRKRRGREEKGGEG